MDLNSTFREILSNEPDLKAFFQAHGLPADPDDPRAARLRLKAALQFKHIDADAFQDELVQWRLSQAEQLSGEGDATQCDLLVRIPCVVQLPVENALNRHIAELSPHLKHSTALVEFGGGWLRDILAVNHPEVVIGAGIEGMTNLMALEESYRAPEGSAYNKDFERFADPKGLFRLLSGVPLVFVVDDKQLKGRKAPESFAELLGGKYEKDLIYPDDGHLLDGILLYYFYSAFGMDGVDRLRKTGIRGAHPSQMIKFGGVEERPAVMLMPYIFARMKAKEPGMRIVWPAEGAPIIPLLMSVRKDITPETEAVSKFFSGPEFGKIMIAQGFFPSSHAEVDNQLPGKLWFPGWQRIYEDRLDELIPVLKARFLEEKSCS